MNCPSSYIHPGYLDADCLKGIRMVVGLEIEDGQRRGKMLGSRDRRLSRLSRN